MRKNPRDRILKDEFKDEHPSTVLKSYSIYLTSHTWCNGHSTSINACEVWGVRTGVQVFRRELHTHIYLD